MAMDKELQLIYEYKDAPAELKAAADAHRKNSSDLTKKKAQVLTATSELETIQRAYDESEKAFRVQLKNWTPKGA